MEDNSPLVLQYSSIQPEQKSDAGIVPATASLACAAIPLLGWAIHSLGVVIFAFLVTSWAGLALGVIGVARANGKWGVAASGAIGALVNGMFAALAVFFFTYGIC